MCNKYRNVGRGGLCGGLKILRSWFNSITFHKKNKKNTNLCNIFENNLYNI